MKSYNAILYKSDDGKHFVAEGVEVNQVYADNSQGLAIIGLSRALEDVIQEHQLNPKVELAGEHSEIYNKLIKRVDLKREPEQTFSRGNLLLRIHDFSGN